MKNFKELRTEAYKGNLSDFKRDVELAVDNMGINTKAIKKVSKKGNGYQAYLSSYMDKDSHEKIAKDVGATLKDFKKDSRGTVGVYEAEDKDPGEYDEEGLMMKDQLDIVMDAADEIYDMVDDNENLPEWCQNKITKAADYIDSVRDYMMSQNTDKDDDDD